MQQHDHAAHATATSDPSPTLLAFFEAAWGITLELAPWLLFGSLIAGVLHVAVPRHLVHANLRGRWGVVKAVLVGVPMPLCSCGVIPAALGLRRSGASRGSSLGFLISTPQTGVDSILVSASFLGWPFALFKVAAAGVMGVAGGWLADHVGETDGLDEAPEDETHDGRPWPQRLVGHALELLRTIWGWLVVGVLASAAINVFIPDQWLAQLGAVGALGAGLAALAVSLPLYVCATASVPIAAALVAGGMPIGAALVFLMAGPATNVATVGAVARGFGRRALVVYLGTLILGSLGAAVLFERFAPSSVVAIAAHEHAATWWAVASAVLLIAVLGSFAFADARLWLRRTLSSGNDAATQVELKVTGMSCDGCKASVERALYAVPGVAAVEIDRPTGRAIVRGSTPTPELCAAVQQAGFAAEAGG